MSDLDKDTKNILIGALVGGVIGIGIMAILGSRDERGRSSFNTIGRVLANIGDMLEENHVKEPALIRDAERKLHREEDNIAEILQWATLGIQLWKKFK